MRRLRMRIPPREVAGLLAVVVVGALIGVMGYVVVDAARAREQATRQLEAQAEQAIDTRAAQTRRIDALSEQVAGLQAEVADQEGTIAAQSQAIADLTAQLHRADVHPITGDPAESGAAESGTRRPGTSSKQPAEPASPQPSASPTPRPAPDPGPSHSPPPTTPTPDEPFCLPLDLLCIGG